ncbi:SulP family inorganic anion transporter, partial [Pseudomonas chlororaphis]|uniref:SulP family inorganic anion transporter n=1 Tax=Pseudomonas chlororaphis TaxID=587753 RepID=UPI003C19972A
RFARLPAALVTVTIATLCVGFLRMDSYGVSVLGPIPSGMPQLSWPQNNMAELKSLLRDALSIATVSFCSAMLTARNFVA